MHILLAITVAVMVTGSSAAPAANPKPAHTSSLNFDSLVNGLHQFYKDNWRTAPLAKLAAAAKALDYYDFYGSYPYDDYNKYTDWLESKLQSMVNAQTRSQANAQYKYNDYWGSLWKKNARTATQSKSYSFAQDLDACREIYPDYICELYFPTSQSQSKSHISALDFETCILIYPENICELNFPAAQSQKARNAGTAKMTKSESIKAALQKALLASKKDKQEE